MDNLQKIANTKLTQKHIPYIIHESTFVHNNHEKANLFANKFCHRHIKNIKCQPRNNLLLSNIPQHDDIYPATNMINNIINELLMNANNINNPRLISNNDYIYKKAASNTKKLLYSLIDLRSFNEWNRALN